MLIFAGVRLWPSRRRSVRVAVIMPVFVYGWLPDKPFTETTQTLNVSPMGALIPLSTEVIPSQHLRLTNLQTDEDLPCRVTRSIRTSDGTMLVGLKFLQASPIFWQIDFASNSTRSPIAANPDQARAAEQGDCPAEGSANTNSCQTPT